MILKKFLFERCVNDFIISHSVSSESYAKYVLNKTDNVHTAQHCGSFAYHYCRGKPNIAFVLHWRQNCCQNAIISILFPSSTKKEKLLYPSSKTTKRFCLILAKFVFPTDFLASYEFHFTRKSMFGRGTDTRRLTEGYEECNRCFSHTWKWPNCFAFMPSMNVTYVLYRTL
jgi:hypothetical protein